MDEVHVLMDMYIPVVLFLFFLLLVSLNGRENDSVLTDASPLLIVVMAVCIVSKFYGFQAHVVLSIGLAVGLALVVWYYITEFICAVLERIIAFLGRIIVSCIDMVLGRL